MCCSMHVLMKTDILYKTRIFDFSQLKQFFDIFGRHSLILSKVALNQSEKDCGLTALLPLPKTFASFYLLNFFMYSEKD